MTIQEIQNLMRDDFGLYQQTLLSQQHIIQQKWDEENIFIEILTIEQLEQKIDEIKQGSVEEYPLAGVPFAVKDNIDVKGFYTTAGCKEYKYMPEESSFVVQQLEKLGAICIGKTNMDQFATGLVGIRSPFGVAKNYYNPKYIPGGSSSGSASAVSAGYVPFSLGTDTAGSGRIPACFQNLIGYKPTKGIVSIRGVVPACKSLDCVTIFANNVKDVESILPYMSEYDADDVYSVHNVQERIKKACTIAVPKNDNLEFFGNSYYEKAYHDFRKSLLDKGYEVSEIDFSPMLEAAKLLYEGPWVAERYHAVGRFIEENPNSSLEVIEKIILGGKEPSASQYFDAAYKLKQYKKEFDKYAQQYDVFITPTAGTIYTIEEINNNPIKLNSNLGYYTNFMNLLDCCAVALPVSIISPNNLPFGITLFSTALKDDYLLHVSKQMTCKGLLNISSEKSSYINLAVCGSHKRNGTLNWQLTDIGAIYQSTEYTIDEYRFYALENLNPIRPGLIRDKDKGGAIEVEIWKIPEEKLGAFINSIDSPLGFGKILLSTNKEVTSFLCEPYALTNAKEITHLQSWERYLSKG